MLRELLHRRVPQFLIAYLVAGWGLVQVLQFVEDRYALSPAWVDLAVVLWLLLIPGIAVLAWSQGAPGDDRWTRRQVVSIGINVVAAVAVLAIVFADRDLGAVTTQVTVEDENGQELVRELPKADYQRSIALFYPEDDTDDPEKAWWVDAAAYLVELDLFQDASLQLRSSFQNREAAQRRGIDDPRKLPSALRREIADRGHRDYFVDGRVAQNGESMLLELTVHETRTGRKIGTESWTGDIFEICDLGSSWVRRQLDIPAAALAVSADLPVAELCTESPVALRAFVEGLDHATRNEYEAAGETLGVAVEADPTFCLAHLQRYGVLAFGTDKALAMESIEAAMQHSYRVPERMKFLIKTTYYSAQSEADKAIAVLEMWAKLSPRDNVPHQLLAQQYRYRGEPDLSIASLERVLEVTPEDASTLRSLAGMYEEKLDFAKAEQIHQRVIALYPEEAAGLRSLARCFDQQGRLDEAMATYEKAALIEPDSNGLKRSMALLMAKRGQVAEAEAQLREIADEARSDSSREATLAALGELLNGRGKVEASLAVFYEWEEVARKTLNPGEFAVRRAMGSDLLARVGRGEEGIARVEKIRSEVAKPFDRFVAIGELTTRVEMEDTIGARKALEEVKSAAADFGLGSLRPVIDYYTAKILELEGDPVAALEQVTPEITMLSGRARRMGLKGRLQRLSGDPKGALETIDAALVLAPSVANVHMERAQALKAIGRSDDAMVALEKALELWSEADANFKPAIEARGLREQWKTKS